MARDPPPGSRISPTPNPHNPSPVTVSSAVPWALSLPPAVVQGRPGEHLSQHRCGLAASTPSCRRPEPPGVSSSLQPCGSPCHSPLLPSHKPPKTTDVKSGVHFYTARAVQMGTCFPNPRGPAFLPESSHLSALRAPVPATTLVLLNKGEAGGGVGALGVRAFFLICLISSQLHLVIKHFLSAWSGPGRVSFHKHGPVNGTALPVSAGGVICIVIVLLKPNNRRQFMKLSIPRAGARAGADLSSGAGPPVRFQRTLSLGKSPEVSPGCGHCPVGGACAGG